MLKPSLIPNQLPASDLLSAAVSFSFNPLSFHNRLRHDVRGVCLHLARRFLKWSHTIMQLNSDLQIRLFQSLGLVLILWLLRLITIYLVNRRIEDVRIRYQWRKTSTYVAVTLGVFLIGRIWLVGMQSLATYLGLVSAGLAVALKEPLVNLAGWAFILWRRPFEVGDRIQIGEHAGDVIDLRIFQFSLLEIGNWVAADQSTGRVVHIPNGKVFSDVLANYSKGFEFIWNEIPVLVTFESDWERAKALLQEIGNRHAAHLSQAAEERVRRAATRFMIVPSALTPLVYTQVEASGVLLTVRYLCEPRERRASAQAMWEDILRVFAEHADIDFAYPTQRFYGHRLEGQQAVENN
jgi:small-conductance mechanosensitive channel